MANLDKIIGLNRYGSMVPIHKDGKAKVVKACYDAG